MALWLLLGISPDVALGCSPPFNPTIEALGPGQLIVVGRVGERVDGGRLFHVVRWFNGDNPRTPILIAFKEGEPVGDCSYPVAAGEQKLIAPTVQEDGTLYADLATLQADPTSAEGQRYLAEAVALFGPGVVPVAPAPEPVAEEGIPPLAIVVGAAAVVASLVGIPLVIRRRSPS